MLSLGTGPAQAAAKGTLKITVSAPAGVAAKAVATKGSAKVSVSKQSSAKSKTVSKQVATGTWNVSASPLKAGGKFYAPTISKAKAQVKSGKVTKVTVTFKPAKTITNLKVTGTSQTSIDVSFTKPKASTPVRVRYAVGSKAPVTASAGTAASIGAGATSTTLTGLQAGTTYSVGVFTKVGSYWVGPVAVTTTTVMSAAASQWSTVSTGSSHTCGLRTGQLWCWGDNYDGKLGLSGSADRKTPTRVGTATDWSSISASDLHTCGIRGGQLWCWGNNFYGQLGLGDTTKRSAPTRVGGASDWTAVSASAQVTCGVRAGQLWCWGDNTYGQLGLGNTTSHKSPVRVGSASDWASVSTSGWHTCGIRAGQLWCWGGNGFGQLGTGASVSQPSPSPARVGSASDWVSVSTSGGHTCGVRAGSLWCWGSNTNGELGVSGGQRTTPVQVGAATDWSSGYANRGSGYYTCGVRAGALWCWGGNDSGQLGVGDTAGRTSPTRVGAESDWGVVAAASSHTCGVRAGGQLWCWGNNYDGQLGKGDAANRSTPTRVTA